MPKNKLVRTENEAKHLSGGFVLPFEVVDGIVVAALKEHLEYLEDDLQKHFKDPEKNWLHEDDVTLYHEYIYCLKKLIGYYGG